MSDTTTTSAIQLADNADEVKFRAYDAMLGRYVYFGLWNCFACAEDMKGSVRQYIGVKDSLGREIYLGDTVSTKAYAFKADWTFRGGIEGGNFKCLPFFVQYEH